MSNKNVGRSRNPVYKAVVELEVELQMPNGGHCARRQIVSDLKGVVLKKQESKSKKVAVSQNLGINKLSTNPDLKDAHVRGRNNCIQGIVAVPPRQVQERPAAQSKQQMLVQRLANQRRCYSPPAIQSLPVTKDRQKHQSTTMFVATDRQLQLKPAVPRTNLRGSSTSLSPKTATTTKHATISKSPVVHFPLMSLYHKFVNTQGTVCSKKKCDTPVEKKNKRSLVPTLVKHPSSLERNNAIIQPAINLPTNKEKTSVGVAGENKGKQKKSVI